MGATAEPARARDDDSGGHVLTRACRHGTLSFFRADDPVGRALEAYGEWAEQEVELLLRLVRPGDVAVDVGANVGTHAVALAARVGPAGKVIAFEPQGPVFELLRLNAVRNAPGTIEVRRQGVAGAPGVMVVPRLDYSAHVNLGAIALAPVGAHPAAEVDEVEVTSIDALDLARCDFLKLDVEGMELAALRGARRTLERLHPILYIECNAIEAGWAVASFCRELGYVPSLHRARAYNPDNFSGNRDNFFGGAHETSLLLLPPDRGAPGPLPRAPELVPVGSLDAFAREMLETTRWGDPEVSVVSTRALATQLSTLGDAARALQDDKAALLREREAVLARERAREERDAALERRLAALARQVADRDAQLAALCGSASWKVTAPLRSATARARRWRSRVIGRLPIVGRLAGSGAAPDLALVAESGLFDAAYYLAHNADVAQSGRDALDHFVAVGGREGRDPSPLFDSSFYLEQNPDVATGGMNPLVHYLAFGAAERRNPNRLFDTAFYVDSHPHVARSGQNPLVHYARHGGAEGLAPSPRFDPAAYLRARPEARESGLTPLAHRLAADAAGQADGAGEGDPRAAKAPRATAPTRAEWEALVAARAAAPARAEPVVDVLVPVYAGFDETLRCLYTALASTATTAHAVVAIEDASPDPALVAELRWLAEAKLLDLLHNERNLGFVATCNRGMALHPGRDVVLLNSDTEVYGDWLDRLRRAATSQPRVGSVTPLSNAAEICSYPFMSRDNDMALELGYAELDAAAARVNARVTVPLPTGVGFCMYIRRRCLDEVGMFDLERFGRGYGEENDFSLRAAERGWTHLLACDVFVRHAGGVSFGAEKRARIAQGLARIAERFPGYGEAVQRFLAADPPREARARLDVARLARRAGSRGGVLFVTHTWGGGIERHVQDMSARLEAEGVAVFFLRPDRADPNLAILSHPDVRLTPNLQPFDLAGGLERLADTLREVGIRHVHVHSLVGFALRAADAIRTVAARVGIGFDVTIHDYTPVCPRINLIDASGVYCGEPDTAACERCVSTSGSPFGRVAVWEWRGAYERLLRGARAVLAPGEDVAARIERHLPGLSVRVRPHPEAPAQRGGGTAVRASGEPLRVALIGAIGPHKGYDLLLACARDALARALPLRFCVVGYTCNDAAFAGLANVTITGRYAEDELPGLLARERCHCALFASVWPETYSYTLSAAVEAGLYPIAFDLGVMAERIRKLGWGSVLPLTRDAAALNDALLNCPVGPAPAWPELAAHFTTCDAIVRDYYGLAL
jgi:FkbM family methyltransferase